MRTDSRTVIEHEIKFTTETEYRMYKYERIRCCMHARFAIARDLIHLFN